jgi:arylsulfatase A-like enzyme
LDQLASESILYENAFAAAPVCAASRSSLITGDYATSLGTQHMRSTYPIPNFIHFYPYYLRKAGYYCTNNSKKLDQQFITLNKGYLHEGELK